MIIPDTLLENKKILLAVTGSIAVYKSLELVRLFTKAGAEVRVVMSDAAKKFVTPLSFETLSGHKVLDDTNECWASDFNHIKITQWADVMVIAPATANTIAKLANAIADTILLQCALAFDGAKIYAPSANTKMLHNPITQANLKMLGIANYTMVETQTKELACKTTGDGAMADVLDIFYTTARELLVDDFYKDRRVIVTGGGTIEKIDEVILEIMYWRKSNWFHDWFNRELDGIENNKDARHRSLSSSSEDSGHSNYRIRASWSR